MVLDGIILPDTNAVKMGRRQFIYITVYEPIDLKRNRSLDFSILKIFLNSYILKTDFIFKPKPSIAMVASV